MSRSSLYYGLQPEPKTQPEPRALYIEKVGIGRRGDTAYGWSYDARKVIPEITDAEQIPVRFLPSAPAYDEVTIQDDIATVCWHASVDGDNDVVGYRVYVRNRPRGWNYSSFLGGHSVQEYWQPERRWVPEMKAALFQLPSSSTLVIPTTEQCVEIKIPASGAVYVTVMPIDKYHEACGKQLYPMSNEISIGRNDMVKSQEVMTPP